MATTFTASKVATSVPAKEEHQGLVQVTATYEIAAALVVNDVIQMVKVPIGARIVTISLAADDLDSGATPLITLDVGDGGDTDRFIAASTIAQAGGIARIGDNITGAAAADCLGYVYTADDTIDVLVHAAPATGATSGTITMVVTYSNDA